MKNSDVIGAEINENDEECLTSLKSILFNTKNNTEK